MCDGGRVTATGGAGDKIRSAPAGWGEMELVVREPGDARIQGCWDDAGSRDTSAGATLRKRNRVISRAHSGSRR